MYYSDELLRETLTTSITRYNRYQRNLKNTPDKLLLQWDHGAKFVRGQLDTYMGSYFTYLKKYVLNVKDLAKSAKSVPHKPPQPGVMYGYMSPYDDQLVKVFQHLDEIQIHGTPSHRSSSSKDIHTPKETTESIELYNTLIGYFHEKLFFGVRYHAINRRGNFRDYCDSVGLSWTSDDEREVDKYDNDDVDEEDSEAGEDMEGEEIMPMTYQTTHTTAEVSTVLFSSY